MKIYKSLMPLFSTSRFHFSKLQYFLDNYDLQIEQKSQVIKTEQEKQNNFYDLIRSNKYLSINSELGTHLGQLADPKDFLSLSSELYSAQTMLTQKNQELLAQVTKNFLKSLTFEEVLLLGQQLSQLGVLDRELSYQYIQIFIQSDTYDNQQQQLDALFVVSLILQRYPDIFVIQAFCEPIIKQWNTVLNVLIEQHKLSDGKFMIIKLPHFTHLIRMVENFPKLNFGLHQFCSQLCEEFLRNVSILEQWLPREKTMLLINLLKMQFNQSTDSIIDILMKSIKQEPLTNLPPASLLSLAISLQLQGKHEKQLMGLIVQELKIRVNKGMMNSKHLLGILYEIYHKQYHKDQESLQILLSQVILKELLDYDLAQFLSLMIIVDDKTQFNKILQTAIDELSTRKPPNGIAADRIPKSIKKILSRLTKEKSDHKLSMDLHKILNNYKGNQN